MSLVQTVCWCHVMESPVDSMTQLLEQLQLFVCPKKSLHLLWGSGKVELTWKLFCSRGEEPTSTNMDISTGHMVLAYMEDHLKNKQRLEQEWVGLCSYEAEPCATSVAFKVGVPGKYTRMRHVIDRLALYVYNPFAGGEQEKEQISRQATIRPQQGDPECCS